MLIEAIQRNFDTLNKLFFFPVPPDILNEDTSGDMSISEGENATLICKAAGHPTPRITWRREDGHPILFRKGLREYTKGEQLS